MFLLSLSFSLSPAKNYDVEELEKCIIKSHEFSPARIFVCQMARRTPSPFFTARPKHTAESGHLELKCKIPSFIYSVIITF